YDRAAIFSRDRFLSSNANQDRFGGGDSRSSNFAGRLFNSFLRVVEHTTDKGDVVPGKFDVVRSRAGAVLDPARVVPTNAPGTHPFALPPQTDLPMALSEAAANAFVETA